MKSRIITRIVTVAFFAALALPARLGPQDSTGAFRFKTVRVIISISPALASKIQHGGTS